MLLKSQQAAYLLKLTLVKMLGSCNLCFSLLVFSMCLLGVHSQEFCPFNRTSPNPPRRARPNCTECFPGYDMSSDCSTCVGAESIQCVEGQQNCSVGTFTFSALFHSYNNPNNMCGECRPGRGCEAAGVDCRLRYLYCLRPYGSPQPVVTRLPQAPLSENTDGVIFENGFIVIGNQDNFWNRSNPFTRQLQLWPGRAQFYIVAYGFKPGASIVLDRFLIDLELSISGPTAKTTYRGIHNVAQFDLSFRIACSENYHGPQCDVFCMEVPGQFTCNNDGTKMCVNDNFSPESNCTQCRVPGCEEDTATMVTTMSNIDPTTDPTADPSTTSADPTTSASNADVTSTNEDATSTNADTSGPDASSSSGAVIGGAIGGVIASILLLIVIVLLLLVCMRRRTEKTATAYEVAEPQEVQLEEKEADLRQFVNPVYGTDEDVQQATSDAAGASTATATTVATVTTTAATVNYDTVDAQYSTISASKTEEHKFVNPIYGDEITSNVYSHTAHNGHSHSEQPQAVMATFEVAPYSHVVLPSETPSNGNDPGQSAHLYSHTNHQPGLTAHTATKHPQTSDMAYDVLNLPQYDDPNTLQVLPPAGEVDGARYEVAEVEPAVKDSIPSSPIYNELEDHTYSTIAK